MLKGPIARRSPTSSPAGARVPARRARSKPTGSERSAATRTRAPARWRRRAIARRRPRPAPGARLPTGAAARAVPRRACARRAGRRPRARAATRRAAPRPAEPGARRLHCRAPLRGGRRARRMRALPRFRRPALQHPVGAPLRLLDGCKPERRLADACLAFQLERRGLAGPDEDRKRSQLALSSTTPDAVRVAMAICRDRTARRPPLPSYSARRSGFSRYSRIFARNSAASAP